MPQWPLAERPSERPAALQALRAHARGSLPCPAKPVWARVFGPMTHSFWACDRAQMHPQPLPLQLRPETPSTAFRVPAPLGTCVPEHWRSECPRPLGACILELWCTECLHPLDTHRHPTPPLSKAAGHFLALLSGCFLGHNAGPPAADLPVSLLFWNLPSVHPPVLCPHHLAPWVPPPSTSEL